MSAKHPLFEEAERIVYGYKARIAAIQKELSDIESRKSQLRSDLHKENDAPKRLSTFVYEQNGWLYCPSCWIENEVRTRLRTAPGDDRKDNFSCPTCLFKFSQFF